MSRIRRADKAGVIFHVLNRANARTNIFATDGDYLAFEEVLRDAAARYSMPIFTFCVMPNHWHLLLRPTQDGQMAQFVHWLTVTHARRWHAFHETGGSGHLYQGPYKSFPVEDDEHFLIVCRYVEQNALRAGLVARAEDWRWSSLWNRERNSEGAGTLLSDWPVLRPSHWMSLVNELVPRAVADRLCVSLRKGIPFGNDSWRDATARALGLPSTVRPSGRPRKTVLGTVFSPAPSTK